MAPLKTLAMLLLATAAPAAAAAQCQLTYQYNAGTPGALQRTAVTLRLMAGETREIDQARLDYVRNLGPNGIRVRLSGAPQLEIVLLAGEQNPDARFGYHFGPRPVTLRSLTCLARDG